MSKQLAFMALVAVFTTCGFAEDARTWKSRKGSTVQAELIEDKGEEVILRTNEGARMAIRRDMLSPEDVLHLDRLNQQAEEEWQRRIDAKIEAEKAPRHIRIVGGVAYDFTPVDQALLTARNRLAELNTEQDKIERDVAGTAKYRLLGKVVQVLHDGLLVDSPEGNLDGYDGIVFVKDYHDQETVVDGDDFSAHGLPTGRHQYVSTIGATKTVTKFICGKTVDPDKWEGEVLPLP